MVSSIIGIAFDCADADNLADFYSRLLGWEKTISNGEYAGIRTPHGILLVFQTVDNYAPPVWPWEDNKPQQMAHIDFHVDNLPEAIEHAIKCGAKKANVQYYERAAVMIDPAGHLFCLSTEQI